MSQDVIDRKELLAVRLPNWNVSTADVREVTLGPGIRASRHLHPCAVVGYIVSGSALYQIDGQPSQTLTTGSAFYEPPSTVIAEFGNASDTDPLVFVAIYLLNGDQDLIAMLPPR